MHPEVGRISFLIMQITVETARRYPGSDIAFLTRGNSSEGAEVCRAGIELSKGVLAPSHKQRLGQPLGSPGCAGGSRAYFGHDQAFKEANKAYFCNTFQQYGRRNHPC